MKKQQEMKDHMQNLTNRVNEKLNYKAERIENDYQSQFEKNILKRKAIEDKKKKQDMERFQEKEFANEKKHEKLMEIERRREDNRIMLERRNQSLEKRWQGIKKRVTGGGNLQGQAAFYESMAVKQEINNRRQWIQQMNLQRKMRQQ